MSVRIFSSLFIVFQTLCVGGCGNNAASSQFGSSFDASTLQKELDANPKIGQKGLSAKVISFENGYATIKIFGLSSFAASGINQGQPLGQVYMNRDGAVAPLVEMEGILKKNLEVKAIVWQADTQN